MATSVVIPSDVAVGDPIKASEQNAQNDALAALNSEVSAITGNFMPNGSFENDLDNDGDPDLWSITTFGTSSYAIETTEVIHGAKSLKITIGGANGYVQAENDELFPVAEDDLFRVALFAKASVANIPLKAIISWRNKAETQVGTVDVIDVSSTDTSWVKYVGTASVPNGAFFAVVTLQGGDAASATTGVIYFDGGEAGPEKDDRWAVSTLDTIVTLTTTDIDAGVSLGVNGPFTIATKITLTESGGQPATATVQGWSGSGWSSDYVFGESVASANLTSDTIYCQIKTNDAGEFRVITAGAGATVSAVIKSAFINASLL